MKSGPGKKEAGSLDAFAVPDINRVVPASFDGDQSVMAAFMRVNKEALPQKEPQGKKSYTVVDREHRAIEINLAKKVFEIKRLKDAKSPEKGQLRAYAWLKYPSVADAWQSITSDLGGWVV